MFLNPLIILVVLLSGAALALILARWRAAYAPLAALVASGLALLLWLLTWGSRPLSATLSGWPAAVPLPALTWTVDGLAWQMSLALLLLLPAGLLVALVEAPQSKWGHGLALLLVATGLAALWADSLAGLLLGWTALGVAWSLALLTSPDRPALPGLLARLGLAWLSVLFLALAAASLPDPALSSKLAMDTWPTLANAWVLLAAVWALGVVPLHLWRPLDWTFDPLLRALVPVVPAGAGALLLARLATNSDVEQGFALLLTLVGLFSLVVAINRAWTQLSRPAAAAAALLVGLAGLVLLAGVWGGPLAVVAEARVMVLAGGVLLLAPGRAGWPGTGQARLDWLLTRGAPLMAAVALAALPLMAAFPGRAAVYDEWLASGRWLLLLVAMLLHVPFLAAAFLLAWSPARLAELAAGDGGPAVLVPAGRVALAGVGLLLPVLGLWTVHGLGTAGIAAWLGVLIPAGGGLAMTFFLGSVREAQATLREALRVPALPRPVWPWLQNAAQAAGSAVRQAAALLEGEGGLLWLLLLLILFWLAQ